MTLKDIGAGVVGLLVLLATSYCISQLFSLDMADHQGFPFVNPWVKILMALLSLIPGVVIGWFATFRPLLIALVVGFLGGVIEDATLYGNLLVEYADKTNLIGDPSIGDYLSSGIAKAIYLCAFTALGVLLRLRAAR